jgi:outer membrane protein insertion porin family
MVIVALWLMGASLMWAQNDVVSDIYVSGNRRIPAETIRARIFTKAGDVYDAAALERDFNSLWNTGYFEDIKILREQTPKGWRDRKSVV